MLGICGVAMRRSSLRIRYHAGDVALLVAEPSWKPQNDLAYFAPGDRK